MASFVYASDLHGNRESYERLFEIEADAVVLGGDLLPHTKGTLESRIEAQRAFARDYLSRKFASRPCYWIAGNDDWGCAVPLVEGGTSIHGTVAPFLDGLSIAGVRACGSGRVVRVELADEAEVSFARLDRNFYTTSSCGVCGKTSLDAIETTARWPIRPAAASVAVTPALILSLPAALREAQEVFASTGGLHASALFDDTGRLLLVREDVGRHNALDKVIGAELLAGRLPAHDRVLLVSGRASFELVQKAAMAAIPVLAAIGAPSSLAAELARRVGMTLIGFVREGRFNVYAGAERVVHG